MYASNTHCHCIDSVQSWFNGLWLSKCPPSLAVDCIDGSVYSWHEQCPVILLFLHVQNMSKTWEKNTGLRTPRRGRLLAMHSAYAKTKMPQSELFNCFLQNCRHSQHQETKRNTNIRFGIATTSLIPYEPMTHRILFTTKTPVLSSLFPCCHWQIYKRCMRERQALSKQAQHPVHCSLKHTTNLCTSHVDAEWM